MKISVMSLLFAVLVVLKLLGHIAISWWWVFAPIWGPMCLAIGLLIVTMIGIVFSNMTSSGAAKLWRVIFKKNV